MRQKLFVVVVLLALYLPWMVTNVHAQVTLVDITGGTASIAIGKSGVIYAFPILISSPRLVWAIGVNWAGTGLGAVRVALYSNNYTAVPYRPSSLLTDSGTDSVATSGGWQDIPVAIRSVTYGDYWVAIQISEAEAVFAIAYPRAYYYRGFGSFNSSWPDSNYTLDNQEQWNMRVIPIPSSLIAQRLEQQNQVNALPSALHAGRYWEWTRIQVLLSMRDPVVHSLIISN
ncbi:MAG: hypothetical protein ABSF09_12750 [Candidatus Bathyarchaeia archaeon]|jgi:hypothetical protein